MSEPTIIKCACGNPACRVTAESTNTILAVDNGERMIAILLDAEGRAKLIAALSETKVPDE